jgi:hypothetical protein
MLRDSSWLVESRISLGYLQTRDQLQQNLEAGLDTMIRRASMHFAKAWKVGPTAKTFTSH